MTTQSKRHEKIKNNPANVRFEEAEAWLLSFGFQEREKAEAVTRYSLTLSGMAS